MAAPLPWWFAAGILRNTVAEDSAGPARYMIADPGGNTILADQHV